jgi:hypothetical protein
MTNDEAIARIERIVTVYFEPWGAGKAAAWEDLTNDAGFTAENALEVIQRVLRAQAAAQEASRASERRHGAGDPARPPSGPDLGGDE